MLSATELRIGNRVLDGDQIRTVTGLIYTTTLGYVWLNGDIDYTPLDRLQPILLSKHVVEACFFEESEDGLWYEHASTTLYPIYLMVINDNWDFSLTDPREVAYWKRIYWLHQLQNLHFALNGEELEVDL